MIQGMIYDYEQMLIGRRRNILPSYFCYTDEQNEYMALKVFKYAFETYLRWKPDEVRDYLTIDIIKMLKLDKLMKYIRFPAELDPSKDLFFYAWKIYPHTVTISKRDLALNVYRNLLDGKIKKFPKDYFTGSTGAIRASICLKYMIEEYTTFENIEELYDFFSSKEVWKTLKKYKLHKICADIYETPVDYLHESLSKRQRDDFLFHYYKFNIFKREVENRKE